MKSYCPMKKCLVLLLGSVLLFTSCKESSVAPKPVQNPPGYQVDVSWPSLADSPWPIYRHDPQNTGRSKYAGPTTGNFEWILDSIWIYSGAAFTSDSLLVVSIGSGYAKYKSGVYAFRPDGKIKWKYLFPDSLGIAICRNSPIIGNDGVIYVSGWGSTNYFFAVNPDGSLKWKLEGILSHFTGMNIGKDGTIYLMRSGGLLSAISKSGELLWSYSNSYFLTGDFNNISISPDSKTLYAATLELGKAVVSFDLQSRTINWGFGKYSSNSPLIDNAGNIYVYANVDSLNKGQTSLFALNPAGNILWSYPFAHRFAYDLSQPTMDRYGNLYLGDDTLFSVDYTGKLRWKVDIYSGTNLDDGIIATELINDNIGNIYFLISTQVYNALKMCCISSTGKLVWSTSPPVNIRAGFSPLISNDGALYMPTAKTYSIIKMK